MCIRDSGSGYPARETGKMQPRATSMKRAAEAEKEINMEDKEATPVEDVERLLPQQNLNNPHHQRNNWKYQRKQGRSIFRRGS